MRKNHRDRFQFLACLLSMLVAALALPAAATNYTWDAAVDADWSDTASWDPIGAPASVADSVFFGATGAGTTNTMDIGGLTIAGFTLVQDTHPTDLGSNTLTTNTLNVAQNTIGVLNIDGVSGSLLQINNSLTVGTSNNTATTNAQLNLGTDVALQVGVSTASRAALDIAVQTQAASGFTNTSSVTAGSGFNGYITNLRVGEQIGFTAGLAITGTLDLSNVTTPGVLDVSGNFHLGYQRNSSGTVLVSDAVDVKIGTSIARGGELAISYRRENDTIPASLLQLGAGEFHAYVNKLNVAADLGNRNHGTLDASQVSAGVLDVLGPVNIAGNAGAIGIVKLSDNINVKIGASATRNPMVIGNDVFLDALFQAGTGTFSAHLTTLTVSGGGFATATRTAELDLSNISDGLLDISGNVVIGNGRFAEGIVTLSENFNTKIGDPAARVTMTIRSGDRAGSGELTALGGTFQAYLTSLMIGQSTGTSTPPVAADGLLDLSAVSSGTLDVSGTVTVATGGKALGTLKLGPIPASAGTLLVGVNTADSKGLVEMDGTTFAITSGVTIDGPSVANQGVIQSTIAGTSAGLDLADAATLTVNQGLIHLIFQAPSVFQNIYWGLRWEGDHVGELTTLANAGKLTWDDTAVILAGLDPVGIFLEEGFTYVGTYMPEPSSMVLVGLGLALLAGHRRRMKHQASA